MERFKIINKIGEGAYSTVYTVKRLEDDKIYALKKVKIKKHFHFLNPYVLYYIHVNHLNLLLFE